MNRILYSSFILLLIVSCSKHSPSSKAAESDTSLTISVADSVGTVFRRGVSDTFLIQLKYPEKLTAVPVVLHYATGATPSEGVPLTDSSSSDTVDISKNQLHPITIVSASGKQAGYLVGFPYVINNIVFNYGQSVFGLAVQGDTIYAATVNGLNISTDGGKSFTTTVTSPAGAEIVSIAVQNSTLFMATYNFGLLISTDGGQTMRQAQLGGPANEGIQTVVAQGDTVYVGSVYNGLYISHDRGQTFSNAGGANGLPDVGVWSIDAIGSKIYVANTSGVYISQNGGTSFDSTSFAKTVEGPGTMPDCDAIAVDGGVIYAADEDLWISKDNGLTFNAVNPATYWVPTYGLSVKGNVICAATYGGLLLSTDGGATFTLYASSWGLSGGQASAVVYQGGNIYVGFVGGNGGMSVLVPR
jgi:hypothetical protein